MGKKGTLRFDEINYWSEIKIEIIRKYAAAFSTIISAQAAKGSRLRHVYIDGFSGAGEHVSKSTGEMVPGSPVAVLSVKPPFTEYHLIDLDERKTDHLRAVIGERPDVFIYTEDCNDVLTSQILPNVRYEQFRRGLCLLDPYGLHLDWEVVRMAGETKAVEIFLNFPVADMNRNVFWTNPEDVDPDDVDRMTAFWGDDSWRPIAYTPIPSLFGDATETKTADNRKISEAYRKRLKDIAGFRYVPEPIPMWNSRNAIVYYLFFASPNATGAKIVGDIFERYRNHGAR